MAVPAVPLPFPGHGRPSLMPFQPRALLAPAKEPQPAAPVSGSPEPMEQAAEAAAGEANAMDAAAMFRDNEVGRRFASIKRYQI